MATWNIQGIRTEVREVIDEVNTIDINIALSETKKKDCGVVYSHIQ